MRKKVDLTYEDERSEALISRHVRIGKDDDDNVQWRERSCHAYISSICMFSYDKSNDIVMIVYS